MRDLTERADDNAAQRLGEAILTMAPYPPAPDECLRVLDYLAEIRAAIALLPRLSADAPGPDSGFDPAWETDTK